MILVTHLFAVQITINWTYQDIHEDFPMLSWYVPSPLKKDKEKEQENRKEVYNVVSDCDKKYIKIDNKNKFLPFITLRCILSRFVLIIPFRTTFTLITVAVACIIKSR